MRCGVFLFVSACTNVTVKDILRFRAVGRKGKILLGPFDKMIFLNKTSDTIKTVVEDSHTVSLGHKEQPREEPLARNPMPSFTHSFVFCSKESPPGVHFLFFF